MLPKLPKLARSRRSWAGVTPTRAASSMGMDVLDLVGDQLFELAPVDAEALHRVEGDRAFWTGWLPLLPVSAVAHHALFARRCPSAALLVNCARHYLPPAPITSTVNVITVPYDVKSLVKMKSHVHKHKAPRALIAAPGGRRVPGTVAATMSYFSRSTSMNCDRSKRSSRPQGTVQSKMVLQVMPGPRSMG